MTGVVVLLIVVSLGVLIWGGRAHWLRRQCPACHFHIPYLASICPYCHQGQVPGKLAA